MKGLTKAIAGSDGSVSTATHRMILASTGTRRWYFGLNNAGFGGNSGAGRSAGISERGGADGSTIVHSPTPRPAGWREALRLMVVLLRSAAP